MKLKILMAEYVVDWSIADSQGYHALRLGCETAHESKPLISQFADFQLGFLLMCSNSICSCFYAT